MAAQKQMQCHVHGLAPAHFFINIVCSISHYVFALQHCSPVNFVLLLIVTSSIKQAINILQFPDSD